MATVAAHAATFFSARSRKAWVSGVLTALGPLVVLLTATDTPLTLRAVLVSLVTGVVAALSVYSTRNKVQ